MTFPVITTSTTRPTLLPPLYLAFQEKQAARSWLYEPDNKEEAITILRRNLPKMSPELANQSYAVLANPKSLTPAAKLDLEGVLKALELRSEYGRPKKELTDPMKYYDAQYCEAAMH